MLKVLRHLIQEVNNADSVSEALGTLVGRVCDSLETDACAILLVDNDKGEFLLAAENGFNIDSIAEQRVPFGKGLVGLVAQKKEPINLDNFKDHPEYFSVAQSGEAPYNAFLGVPILYRKRLLGVIIVEREEERRFDDADEAFLVTLAAQLANLLSELGANNDLFPAEDSEESKLPEMLRGLASSAGVGVGEIVVVYPPADLDAVPDQITDDPEDEVLRFQDAVALTRHEMEILGERLEKTVGQEEKLLFDAYAMMLDSESFQQGVINRVKKGLAAQTALKQVIKLQVKQFGELNNDYLQERAMDVEDLGRRVLANLQGDDEHEEIQYPDKAVLIGNEVTAAHLAHVPEGKLVAIVSGKGSSNSHVAILTRSLGVASVMGVGDLPLQRLQGKQAVVDGYVGHVYVEPDVRLLEEFQALSDEEDDLDADLVALRAEPAETLDGHAISLYMNTGLMADISRAMSVGAEGVGLYRTEIPFMARDRFPTTEEQRIIYRQLLNVFSPKPVVMRALDVGGDKPLPYFELNEDNPFLGWRGIRMLLEHPEIFLSQIRAMLRASEGFENLSIMLPMISDVSEVEESVRLIRSVHAELINEGLEINMPKIGIMIEVPSAVYQARSLAQLVDFLSVGSNDLTQYLLAVDRNNNRVSNLFDALHPAVLKALIQVVEGAHREGKTVSICGEMAGDPAAVILLLAMGFDMLSVSAPILPRIKWVIRKFSMSRARKLLSEVLLMGSSAEIRRHLEFALEEEGLGGLIRAGRH
jgi:phosphotransferase system enzyme I (PtsP)